MLVPTDIYREHDQYLGIHSRVLGRRRVAAGAARVHPYDLYGYLEGLGNPQAQTIPGFNYGCCDYTGSLDLALDPGSIQDITEKTWAAFLSARFNGELGGKPFHFTAGLRRESTDISSSGVGRLPVTLTVNPADPTLLTTTFSETQPITTESDYSYLLPSIDVKLEMTDELQLRFDASRTLTRPAINFLTPVLNVGSLPRVGALTATGGNPALKPVPVGQPRSGAWSGTTERTRTSP